METILTGILLMIGFYIAPAVIMIAIVVVGFVYDAVYSAYKKIFGYDKQ